MTASAERSLLLLDHHGETTPSRSVSLVSEPTHTLHARPPLDGDRGLTRAERSARTTELFATLAGADPAQRNRIVTEVILVNRGVAEAVASRYRDRGVPREDLHQVAYEGLTKAATRFQPDRGLDFLTYAVPTVRGELQRHFRDHGWTVRPTRRIQELQWRINQVESMLAQDLGRAPEHDEVEAELDVSSAEYAEAVRAFGCFRPTSLDMPVGPDSTTTLGELIVDAEVTELPPRIQLEPVVRRLSERDRRILYLRFFEDRTQAQIGSELGVTQMQVSRLLARILGTLRAQLSED